MGTSSRDLLLPKNQKSRSRQYVVAIIASLSFSSMAAYVEWLSPALPKLTTTASYSGFIITDSEASWIVSCQSIGICVGSFLAAWLLNKIGRKKSLLLSGFLMFVPWIFISCAVNAAMIAVCFVIGGIGGAFSIMVGPIYLAEVVDKDVRGKLSVTILFIDTIANVLTFAVGPFVPYLALNAMCAIYPLVSTLAFFFVPESPYYLLMVDREQCARESLSKLTYNITSTELDSRVSEIKEAVEQNLENKVTVKELFLRREYRKGLTIVLIVKTFTHFSGLLPINSYLQTIVEMSSPDFSSAWISVIYGVLQIPSVLLSVFLVDNVGRKLLMIVSYIATCIVLVALGIYFYLYDETTVNLDSVTFLPSLCICLYGITAAIGIETLPFVIFAELLATNIKDIGGLLFTFWGAVLGFCVTKAFNPISELFGVYTMFWFFGVCCFLGTLFSIFGLPETKNKSLVQIQKELRGEGVEFIDE